MSRFVRLAVTSLATLEDTAPPFNLRHPDPQDTLKLGLRMLEAAGQGGADLACLPEGFMAAGLPAHTIPKFAEPLDGPSLRAVADCARRHRMYVVAGAYVAEGGRVANRAVVFDRDAGRDRQGHQRQVVEREAREIHDAEGCDDRQRQRDAGDDRGPDGAQEQQHHKHNEARAEHQGELYIRD